MTMFHTTFSKGQLNGQPTVRATIELPGGTIDIHFVSFEHLLTFSQELMDLAVEVWPDSEWAKEYNES